MALISTSTEIVNRCHEVVSVVLEKAKILVALFAKKAAHLFGGMAVINNQWPLAQRRLFAYRAQSVLSNFHQIALFQCDAIFGDEPSISTSTLSFGGDASFHSTAFPAWNTLVEKLFPRIEICWWFINQAVITKTVSVVSYVFFQPHATQTNFIRRGIAFALRPKSRAISHKSTSGTFEFGFSFQQAFSASPCLILNAATAGWAVRLNGLRRTLTWFRSKRTARQKLKAYGAFFEQSNGAFGVGHAKHFITLCLVPDGAI